MCLCVFYSTNIAGIDYFSGYLVPEDGSKYQWLDGEKSLEDLKKQATEKGANRFRKLKR